MKTHDEAILQVLHELIMIDTWAQNEVGTTLVRCGLNYAIRIEKMQQPGMQDQAIMNY